MNLLCFAVISHERPLLLRHMLDSLKPVSEFQCIQVIISDNSVTYAKDISKLCSEYSFVQLCAAPGISQSQNYLHALRNSRSKYISFLHDDDFLCLSSLTLKGTIEILSSASTPFLFYPKNISFSPGIPAFLHCFSGVLPKPYLLGSFPFSLPVFPCWVYPCIPELKLLLIKNFSSPPFGKYSDISFVEDFLCLLQRRVKTLPYYYFHLQHLGSDSSTSDYSARLRLILRTVSTSSPLQGLLFLISAVLHACTLVLRKLKS